MIVFVHLLNDMSGSPKILSNVINGVGQSGEGNLICVGSDGVGFLDKLSNTAVKKYFYKRHNNKYKTLITYLLSQISLFWELLCIRKNSKNFTIYVNTMMPFGAALFGKIFGHKVVYHLHEVSVAPELLKSFLVWVVLISADKVIYVSDFHKKSLNLSGVPGFVVWNALDDGFYKKAFACDYKHRHEGVFNVLMISSLRDYKGIPEYVHLALKLSGRSDIAFYLVANDDQAGLNDYFKSFDLPNNIKIFPKTNDVEFFYMKSNLLVNLSRPDLCQETFGMTIVEAMSFGIPVIVPPVGGPAEIVRDGVEGLLIDSRNIDLLCDGVLKIADNFGYAMTLSKACKNRSRDFSYENFISAISGVISDGQ